MLQMFDRALFDATSIRETADGYLTAFARIARTGIQEYSGYEVDKPDIAVVRVYRPEEEVFAADAMHSMAHRPVTLNHPKDAVTAENWKEHARGQTGGEVVRDGEFIRVPLVLMDATLVKSVKDKKTLELSVGYSTELKWGKGLTKDGQEYDAIQTQIRGNHLAVVPAARGGSALRIGDDDHDSQRSNIMDKELRTITVDGIEVQVVGDISAKVINRHLEAMQKRIEALQTSLAAEEGETKKSKDALAAAITAHKTEIDTRDGKIVALEKQVKDGEITPAKLDEMVKDRQGVVDAARKIVPKITVDGKSIADIRKEVVLAKLGDSAKTMTDAAIEGAFSAITAGSATARDSVRPLAQALGDSHRVEDQRDTAYDGYVNRVENAWKNPSGVRPAA